MGDFNLDGRPDLLVANHSLESRVSLPIGNGDGTFQLPTTCVTGVNPCSIAVGDLDLDGKPDLGAANCPGTMSMLRNIQGPDFSITTSASILARSTPATPPRSFRLQPQLELAPIPSACMTPQDRLFIAGL
jgi:hypothetical protein